MGIALLFWILALGAQFAMPPYAAPVHMTAGAPLSSPSMLPASSPKTINWAQAAVGALIGFVAGQLLPPFITAMKLIWHYRGMQGTYHNFRNGQVETGGQIDIVQNWDGSFQITGRRLANVEWRAVAHMDLRIMDTGTGIYWMEDGLGVGDQKIRYDRRKKSLIVQGTELKAGKSDAFLHHWISDAAQENE